MILAAGEFKAKCLKLMDDVKNFHTEITITKHGKAIAKLVPLSDEKEKPLFGFLKNQLSVQSDITSPLGEKWDAE